MDNRLPKNLESSDDANSHKSNLLTAIAEGVALMANATDVDHLLQPLNRILMQLYKPTAIEILLRMPESNQLTSALVLRTSGTQEQLFPPPQTNPVALAAIQRGRIITMPSPQETNAALYDIDNLVGIPIGDKIPEGVIVLGFPGKPPEFKTEDYAHTILVDYAAVKLLQLRQQSEDTRKDAHLSLINQVSKAVSYNTQDTSSLRDTLWLIHKSFNLLNLSLFAGPMAVLQISLGGQPVQTGTQHPEGLAAAAYQEQRVLFSNDVGHDPRCTIPSWIGEEAQSEVALPVFRWRQCVGILDLYSTEVNAFSNQDLQTLTILTAQIAVMLEEEQLEALHPSLSAFWGDESPTILGDEWTRLNAIPQAARVGLQADAVTLFRVQNGKLISPGIQSISDDWSLGDKQTWKLAMEALERHQSVWTGASTNLPASLQGMVGEPAAQRFHLDGRAIAVPVGIPDSESGVLVLGFQGNKIIDPDTAGAVDGLASLTAYALHTSELSDDYRRQKLWLALLYEIASDTRKLSSPKEVAETTTQKLRVGMGWARVDLYRWDENAGGLVLFNRPEKSPFVVPSGESLVGQVAVERRLLIRTPEDIASENPQEDMQLSYGEMAVPLIAEEQLRGVLYARSKPGHHFTIEEQSIISAVAELLADTLDSVTLYVRLRHQLQEATTLYHITRSLNNTDNFDYALDEVASVIRNTVSAQHARISLFDEDKKNLITKASSGINLDVVTEETDLISELPNQDPLYTVASTGQSIHIPDMHRTGDGIFMRSSVRSLLAVPLISSVGEIIGTLSVSSMEPDAFSRVDEHLLTVAGGQVAVVIENIELYKDIEARRRHLKFAYDRLQELTKLKDQILQNISHEIRTPLTLIKGYVELIREDGIGGELTPSQRLAIDTISRRADDVVRIVGQIVALQPLNDLSPDRTKVSVSKLLQEVVNVFQHMIKGTQLSLQLDPVSPELYFNGDYEKIQQLCYNILDNSVKFSPNGGLITVRAIPEDTYVHLTFSDQGIGIDERRISRIFDTFYQVDGSSTRRFGGLGLGLAVVNRIVESHRGKVWVESELNKGSVFHVLLPQYTPEN
jgi:signal transduction histidine kinase